MEMSFSLPMFNSLQLSAQNPPDPNPHSGSGSGSGSAQTRGFVPARAPAAESDRVFSAQDRISVRLTKDRRDALAVIAGDDYRDLQPIELIDRALALASRLVRAHSTHASATATLSDTLKSPWQPIGSHVDSMADTLSATLSRVDMQIQNLSVAVERIEMTLLRLGSADTADAAAQSPLSNRSNVAGIEVQAQGAETESTDAATQAATVPQTLHDWLNDQVESRKAYAARSAVVIGRRGVETAGQQAAGVRIACELVAVDGTRLADGSQTEKSTAANVVELCDTLSADVRQALLSDGAQDWCLWCERTSDEAWTIHVHPFTVGGGVGAPVGSFLTGLKADAKRPPLADSMSAN